MINIKSLNKEMVEYLDYCENQSPVVSDSHRILLGIKYKYGNGIVDSWLNYWWGNHVTPKSMGDLIK
jgi:hypothetical protein